MAYQFDNIPTLAGTDNAKAQVDEIINKHNGNMTKIDAAIAEKITQVTLKSSLPTSPTTTNNLYIVYGDTTANNGQYRWNGSSYEKVSTQLDYATQLEAEAGTNTVKVMTPLRTFQAIAKWITTTTVSTLNTTVKTISGAINELFNNKLDKAGDAKDTTVTFSESTTREDLVSGDKSSVLMSKIKKWFTDIWTSLGEKADKQWMPDAWKVEAALPSTYPYGTTYFYSGDNIFNNIGYVVVETIRTPTGTKQIIFRDFSASGGQYVRYNIDGNNNAWTRWLKVDEMPYIAMHLNTLGWKRFATSDILNSHYGFAIFQLGTYFNDNPPFTSTFLVNKTYNGISITPIGTIPVGFEPIIPKIRAVYLNGIAYLELYYNTTGSNFTYMQMSNNLNFTLLNTFIDGSIPSGYNVKEVSLSNSVTTDKIDILLTPESGYTVLKNNSYKDCIGAIHFDFVIEKTSGTFGANEIVCGFTSLFTDLAPISVMFLTTNGLGYDGLCLSASSNKLQTLADVPTNCNKIYCRDVI